MKVKMNKLKCWNVQNFSRCYVPADQYKLGLTVYATYRRQRVYRYCKTTRPKQPIRTSAISLPDLDLPLVKRRQVVYTRLQMNSIINSYSISLDILLTRYMGRQAKMATFKLSFCKVRISTHHVNSKFIAYYVFTGRYRKPLHDNHFLYILPRINQMSMF